MANPNMTDLQLINVTLLSAIRNCANQDPTDACYKFNIRSADLPYWKNLTTDKMFAIAANMDECLFTIRPDIYEILNLQPQLAALIATARGTGTQRHQPLLANGHKQVV